MHPVTALQSDYSLWTRDQEQVLPVLREPGIGMVAYSPLGRGFLNGAAANWFAGGIDDVRVYQGIETDAAINEAYQS